MDIRTVRVREIDPDYDHPDIKRLIYYPNSSIDQIMDDNYDWSNDKKLLKNKKNMTVLIRT